jgi:hypothetical protein
LLSNNRDDRLMVESRIIETIQKMYGAWAGSCQANTDLTGEFGMRARHERGHLLVPHLDEVELVAGAVERRYDSSNAVARKSENSTDTPFRKAFEEEIADGFAHVIISKREEEARY